jgi:hypothetical protein
MLIAFEAKKASGRKGSTPLPCGFAHNAHPTSSDQAAIKNWSFRILDAGGWLIEALGDI